jgi:excisionase family DNA binding protein
MPSKLRLDAELLTVTEVAELLKVSARTVHQWIEKESIPFVTLPTGGTKPSYRVPLQGLLGSLSGTYDFEADAKRALAQEGGDGDTADEAEQQS